MNDTMIHRGPDDSGQEIYNRKSGYSVGLGQRRLAIFDLSEAGHQPMTSFDGRVSIVFNGEIYNFKELKTKLNYPFSSNCDTEVILAAYLKWGTDCIKYFNGMFAIALFDRETEQLILFRDRVGKKPIYYWIDNDDLYYASEIKAIMALPHFRKEINKRVMHRYLLQSYINAPDTIFKDLYPLLPGTVAVFNRGKLEIKKDWDTKTIYKQNVQYIESNYNNVKNKLKKKIIEAVKLRMDADVPVGTFLSGGFDSSLVTAIAQSISDTPVNTFTIGVNDEKLNEAEYAKEIAKYLGTSHIELYIDEKEMWNMVEDIPRYYDEPFADSSQIPTMLISRLAKDYVTVALSGDGGDEFFCGYSAYRNIRTAQLLNSFGELFHIIGKVNFKNKSLEEKYPLKLKIISDNRDSQYQTQIISKNYIDVTCKMLEEGNTYNTPKYSESSYDIKNWQIRKMLLDMDTYLPGDILTKVDRASMKYSLECRCPLLDKNVMEYSFRIPHRYKYHYGDKKYILKDIAYEYIPRGLLDRPKQGFSIPINKWLRGLLSERLLDFSDTSFLKKQGIFNADYTNQLIRYYLQNGDLGPGTGKNYSKICWNFFVFQKWYEYWM